MKDNRYYRNFNIAASESSDGLRIEGRAIAFDKHTKIHGFDSKGVERRFYEVIDSKALDNCNMSDVPLRSEHDTKTIYARTRNKSLILDKRPDGLYISANLLDNEESRSLLQKIKTGLIDQMSFAFPLDSVVKTEGIKGGLPVRRVMEIPQLLDVSVCAYGAYGGDTFVSARSFDWMIERENDNVNADRRIYQLKLNIIDTVAETERLLKG